MLLFCEYRINNRHFDFSIFILYSAIKLLVVEPCYIWVLYVLLISGYLLCESIFYRLTKTLKEGECYA